MINPFSGIPVRILLVSARVFRGDFSHGIRRVKGESNLATRGKNPLGPPDRPHDNGRQLKSALPRASHGEYQPGLSIGFFHQGNRGAQDASPCDFSTAFFIVSDGHVFLMTLLRIIRGKNLEIAVQDLGIRRGG
jgi:hypothetical protein